MCMFCIKERATYDIRSRYWSSDVFSSDLQDSFKSLLTAYQQDPSQLDEPIATAYARMDDLVATVVEDARCTVAEPRADELAELYEQFLASNAELQELNNENAGDFAATTIFYTETITPLLEGLD